MAGLGGPPNLVPTICTYRAYFSSPETDPFSGDYEAVLEPYLIDLINAAAKQILVSVSYQIYMESQKGYPTAFPPMTRYARARQVSGSWLCIVAPLREPLHKLDGPTFQQVGQ